MRTSIFIFLALLISCNSQQGKFRNVPELLPKKQLDEPPELIADSFRFPVGGANTKNYYNAQEFGKNTHLGEDWNGKGGGNSDLGDPVFCIGNGHVVFAQDHGFSWGNVMRIVHHLPDGSTVESLYAHLDTMLVTQGEWIAKGTQVGTIGTADGYYPAHLHFEMRNDITMPIGPGYSNDTTGYMNPSTFILSKSN